MQIRQMQKEKTKQKLIETAFKVFSQKGIMSTRISDIAKEAGVSHGAVFVHFASQEMLIAEVISVYGHKIATRTHQMAEEDACLADVLRAHIDVLSEYEPFYTRLVLENRLLPTVARDTWVTIQSAVSFHFSQAVKREWGNETPIPVHMLFNIWMGLVHYYISNSDLFAPKGSVLSRCGGELMDAYLKLIDKGVVGSG